MIPLITIRKIDNIQRWNVTSSVCADLLNDNKNKKSMMYMYIYKAAYK